MLRETFFHSLVVHSEPSQLVAQLSSCQARDALLHHHRLKSSWIERYGLTVLCNSGPFYEHHGVEPDVSRIQDTICAEG